MIWECLWLIVAYEHMRLDLMALEVHSSSIFLCIPLLSLAALLVFMLGAVEF